MAEGTAHIVFAGGGLTLPVDTTYDRQLLLEHVRGCARRQQYVQVSVDHTTWMIERRDSLRSAVCGSCARHIADALCRRPASTTAYCVACALARPQLTIALLEHLPATTILRDVQAHCAYGGEWISWTRWAQATPAEIIDDMRLQRRFAPVLIWRCAEIRRLPPSTSGKHTPKMHPIQRSTPVAGVSGKAVTTLVTSGSTPARGAHDGEAEAAQAHVRPSRGLVNQPQAPIA